MEAVRTERGTTRAEARRAGIGTVATRVLQFAFETAVLKLMTQLDPADAMRPMLLTFVFGFPRLTRFSS